MGRFQNLSQVGMVLSNVISTAVPGGTEVLLNVPLENPEASAPAVRVTLLWTTPQPGHRSDPEERNSDGTMAPPPPTISAWYAISTYGVTDEGNAIAAHDLLGQIIRTFHVQPTLELPIGGMGEGRMHVVQVPTDAELTEKIYTPLMVRQRPWALFDVGPVQLLRTEPPGPEQPLVHPGGIRLGPIDVVDRPRVLSIAPSTVGVGGRVRLNATYTGAPSVVLVGGTEIVPPAIAAMEPDGPVLVTLPGGVTEGTYDLTLTAAGSAGSEPSTLVVVEAARPSVDAPIEVRHSRAVNLVLTGRALGAGPVDVLFWPDAGISAPSDVVTISGNAAGNSITILAASLAPLRNTIYRISLQYSTHGFTLYVVLEVTA